MAFTRLRERIELRVPALNGSDELAARLNVPTFVARLFASRGLNSYEQCEDFFNPQLENMFDPFLFNGMNSAVERVTRALSNREKIVVYGDYDADGVTATVLLMNLLRRLGADCDYYLPNRLTEGYGMSMEAIRAIASAGAGLVITVDCGVGACEEIAEARQLGIDVIVTDHHEPHGALPAALALLNPRLDSCGYPERNLAGVGVALKLCQALCSRLLPHEELWQQWLDLAALGTAADIVPLSGENRIIVAQGLLVIQRTANVGLGALIREQGLESSEISSHHVVFQLAPCINAVGRLGDARRAVELLLASDSAAAAGMARELVEANGERRALHEQVEREAVAWVETNCDETRDAGIVAANPAWHQGVVGIVASKLVERFYRPSLLFSIHDGVAHGSGRTVAGIHLLDALTECADLFLTFGGHAAAAGMTLKESNLPLLRERFSEAVRKRAGARGLAPVVYADAEVPLEDMSAKVFRIIERMRPFGPSNMRPVFVCRGLVNAREPRIVGTNHLKLCVKNGATVMDAIAFGFGERLEEIKTARNFSVAFNLDQNEWNGRTTLQMVVKGVEI